MSHTYSCLPIHLVFSTKNRMPWLTPALRARVFPYINGIIQQLNGKVYTINGMFDHAHIFGAFPPAIAPAEAVRTIKANSSKWIHEERLCDAFRWQTGYGAFAIGRTETDMISRYIEQQETHHRTVTFQDEFLKFLHDYDIEYDPKYIWD